MKTVIKELREINKYTQSDLASFLGISRQMYIKYETGEVEPPISIVKKLSTLFKVNYATIIDGNSHPKVEYKIKEQKPLCVADSASNVLYSQSLLQIFQNLCYLKYEELFKLLTEVVNLMEEKKSQTKILSQNDNLTGFYKFSGKIKTDYSNKSYKDLLCAEIDYRYGNNEK